MDIFDLNFWREPDWQRESTINPNFLMVVMVALCLVFGGWLTSHTYHSKRKAAKELVDIQGQHSNIKKRAEEIKELQQQTSFWESKLEELNEEKKRKVIVSRQLEALQQIIPDEITLQSFRLNLNIVDIDSDSSDNETEKKFQYLMNLTGIAGGKKAQKSITDFAGRLRPGSDNIIGRSLRSYELKQISGGSGRNRDRRENGEKEFKIECLYQPR